MAYIDRTLVQKCLDDLSSENLIGNENDTFISLAEAKDRIEELPTADVVPKSESEFDSIPVEVAQVLKDKAVEKAKADVARQIFAELETKAPWFCESQTAYEHFIEELAELKKKYPEGKT